MSAVAAVRAHPRSRGEHYGLDFTGSVDQGSSPLARGALWLLFLLGKSSGLIPARAGSTGYGVGPALAFGAHPRSRGEHQLKGAFTTVVSGSSPLARGARMPSPWRTVATGLIPARAGSTCCTTQRKSLTWAHPRSRGEH